MTNNWMHKLKQVTIVGTGLLGGSIGLGLRAAGYRGRVVGVGRRKSTLEAARQRGCIDEGVTDLPHAAAEAGLIILATPLQNFPELLEQIAASGTSAVVTDVGSTKVQVCRDARRLLGEKQRFIGSHPMAGGEKQGPQHAQAQLLRGAPCIVTPEDGADGEALALIEQFWSALGMHVMRMAPQEHDHLAARISHLPHAVAVLLVAVAEKSGGLSIASTGFADTTRVASGDAAVWLDIFITNRQPIVAAIDEFAHELAHFRKMLAESDDAGLLDRLTRSKQVRDQWVVGSG